MDILTTYLVFWMAYLVIVRVYLVFWMVHLVHIWSGVFGMVYFAFGTGNSFFAQSHLFLSGAVDFSQNKVGLRNLLPAAVRTVRTQ